MSRDLQNASANTDDALAMLDQWAEGKLADVAIKQEPNGLSQTHLRRLWQLLDNPGKKQTLDGPVAIPR